MDTSILSIDEAPEISDFLALKEFPCVLLGNFQRKEFSISRIRGSDI